MSPLVPQLYHSLADLLTILCPDVHEQRHYIDRHRHIQVHRLDRIKGQLTEMFDEMRGQLGQFRRKTYAPVFKAAFEKYCRT